MTNPSRPVSNGREAASGSSLRRRQRPHRGEAADERLVDARPRCRRRASMSASPRRIVSHASPIAWPPVAQAETVVKFGPVIPKLIAIWPAPTLGMPIGMRNGLIRSGPRRALVVMPSTRVPTPPRPVPRMTPVRSASSPSSRSGRPAWSMRLARGDEPELDVAVRPAEVLAVEDVRSASKSRTSAGDPATSAATGRTTRSSRDAGPPGRRRPGPRSTADVRVPRARVTQRPSRRCSARRAAASGGQGAERHRTPPWRPAHRTSFPVRTVAAR